ncbi:MAG: PHB depolymerase family esterase, partial [candidate division WOR-3 bacterium]
MTVLFLVASVLFAAESTTTVGTIIHRGIKRHYVLHLPVNPSSGQPLPLVIVLHGGGGDAAKVEALTGFSRLADTAGFVVAYPEAVNRHWNDGRNVRRFKAQREQVDDVGFIELLIDQLVRERRVDHKRVYATGISNGGMMCHRLGIELGDRLAAIAPVAAGLPEPLAEVRPAHPVSVLAINGTADPLVPYAGGGVGLRHKRGRVLSAPGTACFWVQANGCAEPAVVETLPAADSTDRTKVVRSHWSGGRESSEVLLYTVVGGGHTWPSGTRRPRSFGRTSRNIDATRAIWEFFKKHSR